MTALSKYLPLRVLERELQDADEHRQTLERQLEKEQSENKELRLFANLSLGGRVFDSVAPVLIVLQCTNVIFIY